MNKRYLLITTVLLVGLGFFLMTGGLLYDVAFAGIPYQDPPPELAAEYAANQRMATNLFIAGGMAASLGAVAAVILAFLTVRSVFKHTAGEAKDPEG